MRNLQESSAAVAEIADRNELEILEAKNATT